MGPTKEDWRRGWPRRVMVRRRSSSVDGLLSYMFDLAASALSGLASNMVFLPRVLSNDGGVDKNHRNSGGHHHANHHNDPHYQHRGEVADAPRLSRHTKTIPAGYSHSAGHSNEIDPREQMTTPRALRMTIRSLGNTKLRNEVNSGISRSFVNGLRRPGSYE
jgi:hypothetical protein